MTTHRNLFCHRIDDSIIGSVEGALFRQKRIEAKGHQGGRFRLPRKKGKLGRHAQGGGLLIQSPCRHHQGPGTDGAVKPLEQSFLRTGIEILHPIIRTLGNTPGLIRFCRRCH